MCDFFRSPSSPHIVRHNHGHPGARMAFKASRPIWLFHDVRICYLDRHTLELAA